MTTRLQKLSDGYRDTVIRCIMHVSNRHTGLLPVQVEELMEIKKVILHIFSTGKTGSDRHPLFGTQPGLSFSLLSNSPELLSFLVPGISPASALSNKKGPAPVHSAQGLFLHVYNRQKRI
jgi:hypothetical protein